MTDVDALAAGVKAAFPGTAQAVAEAAAKTILAAMPDMRIVPVAIAEAGEALERLVPGMLIGPASQPGSKWLVRNMAVGFGAVVARGDTPKAAIAAALEDDHD